MDKKMLDRISEKLRTNGILHEGEDTLKVIRRLLLSGEIGVAHFLRTPGFGRKGWHALLDELGLEESVRPVPKVSNALRGTILFMTDEQVSDEEKRSGF